MAKENSNPLAISVPIPIFNGENYHIWSIKMKTYLLSQDLWEIVNDGFYEPADTVSQSEQQQKQLKESKQQKDKAALFILQQAVDDDIFTKISLAKTANEAWYTLKEEFQSINPQITTNLAEGRGPGNRLNLNLESLIMAAGNSNPLAISVPIPIFKGENYDIWSIKMKTYFLSQDLWGIVNDGFYDPTYTVSQSKQQQKQLEKIKQKDKAALFILQQAMDDNIFPIISLAQTANEAWCALKEEFQSINPQITNLAEGRGPEDFKKYLPLYKAILEGDLKYVREVCVNDKNALEARITVNLDTALHVAVGTGQANHIVEYLLNEMSMDQVSLRNKQGNTVLSIAAIVGNVRAATMILSIDVDGSLLYISNDSRRIPLIEASLHGQKKMIEYLWRISKKNYLDYASAARFHRTSAVFLVKLLISSGFYEMALKLVEQRPALAKETFYGGESLLSEITEKASVFSPGESRRLQFWKFFVSSKVPNCMKEREETKLMYDKALELVKHLCKEITKDLDLAPFLLKLPLLRAAELGVYQVMKEILKSYPDAIWFTNRKNHNIFHLAVMNRQEKVLQLIYQMSGRKRLLLMSQDVEKNNILHLAGKLAPRNKLNAILSPALQMQSEVKWFKDVENIVPPDYQEETNSKGQTPAIVFTEEHKELVKDGEKWLKDVATSCSVAAAFIATIVFAAVITIPGDYTENGNPNLYGQIAFKIFSISNAVSLFSSVSAIIMFLSFFTARYGEQDFLHVLPNMLWWCLSMLLLSLGSLMVAFCTCAYLVYYDRKTHWIIASVFASALLPLSLFAYSQWARFLDVLIPILRPAFLCKQRTGVLY